MLYLVLFITLAIFFSLVFVYSKFKELKKYDEEKIAGLIRDLHEEQATLNGIQKRTKVITDFEKRTQTKVYKIRLDLITIEDDMKAIIPELLK